MKKKIIIAGPCSAESYEQLFNTAKEVSKSREVSYLRAGVWKPRTRPGSFEGHGKQALVWLKDIKDTLGIKVATEIATAKHAELALKYGVDLLWIGARTTTSPFAMQELAEVLRGVKNQVFVKNPINPDLGLWMGGIERLASCNIKNIGAIHRGFSTPNESRFRNAPLWSIPLKLKEEMPGIPLICDPSHIAGHSDLVEKVALRSYLYSMDGLMIEAHISPSEALSDAKQQITPSNLKELLKRVYGVKNPSKKDLDWQIDELRKKIDAVDDDLITELALRMRIAAQIGDAKEILGLQVLSKDRMERVLERMETLGEKAGLPKSLVKDIGRLIHKESCKLQEDRRKKGILDTGNSDD